MTNLDLLQTLSNNVCAAYNVDPNNVQECLKLAKKLSGGDYEETRGDENMGASFVRIVEKDINNNVFEHIVNTNLISLITKREDGKANILLVGEKSIRYTDNKFDELQSALAAN